jgi:hypothetical protein
VDDTDTDGTLGSSGRLHRDLSSPKRDNVGVDNVTYTETTDIVRERRARREVDGHRIVGGIAHGLLALRLHPSDRKTPDTGFDSLAVVPCNESRIRWVVESRKAIGENCLAVQLEVGRIPRREIMDVVGLLLVQEMGPKVSNPFEMIVIQYRKLTLR